MSFLVKLIGSLVVIAFFIVGVKWFNNLDEKTKPTPEDDGIAISKVLEEKFASEVDLRVSHLVGAVQATASDPGWRGYLPSGLIVKVPYRADYFVDLSKMDRRKFFWNASIRTLIVNPPDVRVDSVDIDERRLVVVQTTGVWITREAMARLRQRASGRAEQVVQREAASAKNMVRAREAARREIADLYQRPLTIAGLDAHVVVQFEGEGRRNSEQWDRSRSLEEILAAGK